MNLNNLLRENIKALKPYSSARDEFTGEAQVFLDANENPFNKPYNRYPDPLQRKLKEKISKIKGVPPGQIFLGNGSDEPIDLLIRVFCEPRTDNIVMPDPTYGMYEVAAGINNVEVRKVALDPNFQLDVDGLLAATDKNTKLIFLCSPNNPTGNCLDRNSIVSILERFQGVVALDEAYIDFVSDKSFLPVMAQYENLVILQTFSKAWGMAGIRLGMAFAQPEIISILSKVKYPYNLSILTQEKVMELLEKTIQKDSWVKELLEERVRLEAGLAQLPATEKVYLSDANFVLVKIADARRVYESLVEKGIIVRDRSKVRLCNNCLRITVGTREENDILVEVLKTI
jgi:histidinol-phosphate aminotransferase